MDVSIEEISTFCKRKGFVFKSSEIYGGFAGFWDYGPLGAELFSNLKRDFWEYFVQQKENMVGIEASTISHPKTWKASGHIDNFNDIAVVNRKTKQAMKIDKGEADKFLKENPDWTAQGEFSLMFKTNVGPLNPTESYLRGETAQGMFLNFNQIVETSRKQLPFGVLQIGRCFRNEIAPRDFIFRCREFTIGELEFFIHPEELKCDILEKRHLNLKIRLLDAETQENGNDKTKETTIEKMIKAKKLDEWHAYWLSEQVLWFERLGLSDNLKIREHMKSELSHYSSATFDLDYEYPFGSKEVGGNANRGQYDLTQHAKESNKKLDVFDENSKQRVVPRVIEPTFGMDRIFLALLCKAYTVDKKRENIVLRLPAKLAPYKAAILPLIAKGEVYELSRKVLKSLQENFNVVFDKGGSIGKRYARNDEIGTPLCITIDEDSLKKKTVTIRDRDTTKQVIVKIDELEETIRAVLKGESVLKLGKEVNTRVK